MSFYQRKLRLSGQGIGSIMPIFLLRKSVQRRLSASYDATVLVKNPSPWRTHVGPLRLFIPLVLKDPYPHVIGISLSSAEPLVISNLLRR
jgi:hypothetical protein